MKKVKKHRLVVSKKKIQIGSVWSQCRRPVPGHSPKSIIFFGLLMLFMFHITNLFGIWDLTIINFGLLKSTKGCD